MSENPYDNNKKDTYLTLEVLAAVLENLSESGKIKVVHFYQIVFVFKTWRI
jgi:hypothetical protein